jgi:DNA polymerase III epsilon subunit-like protein
MDGGAVCAKNFFFTVDSMDPGAYRVHKLSPKKLKVLSGGKRFADFAEEIHADFFHADIIVAHNFRFDYKFIAREFERAKKPFRYKESLCTMKYFIPHCKLGGTNRNTYKFPTLFELSEHFGIGAEEAAGFTTDIFFCGGDLSETETRRQRAEKPEELKDVPESAIRRGGAAKTVETRKTRDISESTIRLGGDMNTDGIQDFPENAIRLRNDINTDEIQGFSENSIGLHDARYDAALMYLCVKKALKEEKDLKLLNRFTV